MLDEEGVTPGSDYRTAVDGAALFARPERRFVEVTGKAPEQMLTGILSGRIPGELSEPEAGWRRGEVSYSAVLTPKGRMITDLRLFRQPEGGFLLDLPESGLPGALAHLRMYLPPRLAGVADISEELVRLTSHLEQFSKQLRAAKPVGRSLDFLCQELFREINTIGSKANDARISGLVITFKTSLERIREQVQNVE